MMGYIAMGDELEALEKLKTRGISFQIAKFQREPTTQHTGFDLCVPAKAIPGRIGEKAEYKVVCRGGKTSRLKESMSSISMHL